MNQWAEMLDFPRIIDMLKEQAVSDGAKARMDGIAPELNEERCRLRMAETTAARAVLDACGSPPLAVMKGLAETLSLSQAGAMLTPQQLTECAQFATSCRRMNAYLKRGAAHSAQMAAYGQALPALDDIEDSIGSAVTEDAVRDDASAVLRDLRRKLETLESRIREKLNQLLQSHKSMLADGYITTRAGRWVLPVQRRFQSQFAGSVVDASASGGTVFIEPAAAAKLQAERDAVAVAEDAEARRILYALSGEVADRAEDIARGMRLMEELDVLFAKARLSAAMRARAPEIGGERALVIRAGRHPLLDPQTCVPLDFALTPPTQGVIVTGPNTGGKTVTLKTVGLLTLMAQSGLHIPCGEGTRVAMQDAVWCDIGDGQNLSQNLSTFSGHMTRVIEILRAASRDSLVLLDELGSGTDPAEGMGIAVSVLEELRRRGCMFLVTTHYPRVRTYAETTENVITARMAFDPETLAPLYRLEMGKSGESCALHIARRLGLPEHLLARARREAYGGAADSVEKPPRERPPRSGLTRAVPREDAPDAENASLGGFQMGDSVTLPTGEIGIVYRPADDMGNVIVHLRGEKLPVRWNRLRLKASAADLYPPDYDFSIIFDTVANRKAAHVLGKRYDADAVVVHDEGRASED